jgi:hypothetical protein
VRSLERSIFECSVLSDKLKHVEHQVPQSKFIALQS